MHVLNSFKGIITSPGWPEDYPNDLNCSVRLQPPMDGTLCITIDDIEIEDERGGCIDSLQV